MQRHLRCINNVYFTLALEIDIFLHPPTIFSDIQNISHAFNTIEYPADISEAHLMRFLEAQLRDAAIKSWRTSLNENTFCKTYFLYESNYGVENTLPT